MNKSELGKILADMRVAIPAEVEKEILEQYGSYTIDDEGHEFQYTEQDICEQLRKKLRSYEKAAEPPVSLFADGLSLSRTSPKYDNSFDEKNKPKGVKKVEKVKDMHIVFKRINFDRYIVDGKVMGYLELVNWFRDIVVE